MAHQVPVTTVPTTVIAHQVPVTTVPTTVPTVTAHQVPWSDPNYTQSLFKEKVLVIKKSETGRSLDSALLRKTCVDNGIQVNKSFATSRNETAIVVNSEKAAKILIEKLKITAPDHKVSDLPPKTPTITLVGIPNDIGKDDLKYEIFQQNPIIKKLNNDFSDENEGKFSILSISKLKHNNNLSKAIIGISNTIRDYIANGCNDRLYLGNGTCKVYDSFHVKRCFKCQCYGHISEGCSKEIACGYCAEPHETRNCEIKDSLSLSGSCCTNCKNSEISEHRDNCIHPAYSVSCPMFKAEQVKLKQSIPFYRKK